MGMFVGKEGQSSILHLYSGIDNTPTAQKARSIFHSDLPYIKTLVYESSSWVQGVDDSRDFYIPPEQLSYYNSNTVVLFYFQDSKGIRYPVTPNISQVFTHAWSQYGPSEFMEYNVFNPTCSGRSRYFRPNPVIFPTSYAKTTNVDQQTMVFDNGKIGTTLPDILKLIQVVLPNITRSSSGGLTYYKIPKSSQEIRIDRTTFNVGGEDILNMGILAKYPVNPYKYVDTPNGFDKPVQCRNALPGQPSYLDFQQQDFNASIILPGPSSPPPGIPKPVEVKVRQSQGQFQQGISDGYLSYGQVKRVGVWPNGSSGSFRVPIFGIHGVTPPAGGLQIDSRVPSIKISGVEVYSPNQSMIHSPSPYQFSQSVPQYSKTLEQTVGTQEQLNTDIELGTIAQGLSGSQSAIYSVGSLGAISLGQYCWDIGTNFERYLNIPAQQGSLQQIQSFDYGLKVPIATFTTIGQVQGAQVHDVFGFTVQVYLMRYSSNLSIRQTIRRTGYISTQSFVPIKVTVSIPQFYVSILPFREA